MEQGEADPGQPPTLHCPKPDAWLCLPWGVQAWKEGQRKTERGQGLHRPRLGAPGVLHPVGWQPGGPLPQRGPTAGRLTLFQPSPRCPSPAATSSSPSCRTSYNSIEFCRQILKRHLEKLIAYQGKDFIKVVF